MAEDTKASSAMRVAWITGGSSGIGFATARLLLEAGYSVAISARNEEKLVLSAKVLSAKSEHSAFSTQHSALSTQHSALSTQHSILPLRCDVRNEQEVEACHKKIVESFGPVSVLINAAGISPFSTFTETSTQEFDDVIETNLYGMFLTTRLVLPAMYERKEGAIVQLLSIASTKAFKGGAAYVASKFGGLGFTNALREEARKHGVKVIAIMSGATETDVWSAEDRAKYHERMMQPEDIAQTIVRVLSEPARMLTEEIVIRPIGGDL